MSKGTYTGIFSRQLETIAFIILRIFLQYKIVVENVTSTDTDREGTWNFVQLQEREEHVNNHILYSDCL